MWSQACSDAVHTLKTQLTSTPVLAHFDISSSTLMTCDAFAAALGTVLLQIQNGNEKPITFASCVLNRTRG